MSQDILTAISDAVGTEVFGIWFLIGAALVFFMQAGFAMVEAGFTRAKNAGNIIMTHKYLLLLSHPSKSTIYNERVHISVVDSQKYTPLCLYILSGI